MMIIDDLNVGFEWSSKQGICAPENWGRDLGGSSRKSAAHAETVANLSQLVQLGLSSRNVYGVVYPGPVFRGSGLGSKKN
ncbi:uncharacterized protein N7473_011609 [Penicillium subrubescens]|jgi:hypothetical protein|uniref:Uncharacterized protein n=1 Tax=Penicillium subrubescens TaxID=1316194 RepID=A0A1Q5TML5_9EURO|nr:uncharacterized protein N7473_011609 [Penicillium subrubescens]KAJ5880556.1 hypothetical protein N7473_011609 [Penicillium subrubescens]OKP01467.1 hypothetical protein PENSUB_7457 [Penicillium subrubescens]